MIENTHGLIWVVDSTDRKRINESKTALHTILEDPKLADHPLIVFCNKQDQEGLTDVEIAA